MTEVFAGLVGDGASILSAARYVPRIGINVTTVPPGVPVLSGGSPRRLMKVGWIAPSRLGVGASWPASVFAERAKWIDFEREQLSYPAPGVFADRVRYHLEPGVVATLYVDDLVDVPPPNNSLAPWDRGASVWTQTAAVSLVGGTGITTGWTYTVPAGKTLMVEHLDIQLERASVAAPAGLTRMWATINGAIVAIAQNGSNVVGALSSDGLRGGALFLLSGSVIALAYDSNDSGGAHNAFGTAAGVLFNV